MTKPKPKPKRALDAVLDALGREEAKRPDELKPIEIVKIVICAYLSYENAAVPSPPSRKVESADRTGLHRGTQASVDRLLFNANYWLSAYEDRIVASCEKSDAEALLDAVTVWGSHTLKLNKLSPDETVSTFERFCPPFAANNRRGSASKRGAGKGPLADFNEVARDISMRKPAYALALSELVNEMESEAAAYEALSANPALDAFFDILPAWCLQERIALVAGSWWEDANVMTFLAGALKARFLALGYGEAPCQYFYDSFLESVDAYQRDISANTSPFASKSIPELLELVHSARQANPNFETDGYGDALPSWLISKEQLIWNTLVCALYGPGSARPLLSTPPSLLAMQGLGAAEAQSDIITDLAKTSFTRYSSDRTFSETPRSYTSFFDQPSDLRNSSIEHIKSIPDKLSVLGYEIVPGGSCYPEQRISEFSPSEVECLAILEHRRWIEERSKAGWSYGKTRDVDARTSPYMVPWEELPDRVREWNRSAVRNIPMLLATQNLAIAKK